MLLAQFTVPDTEAFPIMTPIPFALHITTNSKPVKRDEPLPNDSIFPAPPTTPHTGVELKLMRNVYVRANHQDGESFSTLIDHLGGFGPEPSQTVHTDVKDNVWEPCHDSHNEKKHLGTWKQEVVFRSHFAVQCAPTFQSRTMRVDVRPVRPKCLATAHTAPSIICRSRSTFLVSEITSEAFILFALSQTCPPRDQIHGRGLLQSLIFLRE